MAEWIKVAETTEVVPGAAIKVTAADKEIALFNVGGSFCAIDETCPHRGGSLSEGSL